MKVRELMTEEVATVTLATTLNEIASKMKEEDTGAIPVLDEDKLAGIVTDRDIVIRCIAEGKDPNELTAEDILSRELETIEPDADVQEAARIMARRQVRRQPGADRSGRATRTRAASRAKGKGQGISNRGNKLEQARQGKVAPMRAGGRGSQKKRRAS